MEIAALGIDIKTINRLHRAGLYTVDEVIEKMYQPDGVKTVSEPDAKRIEHALKSAGRIRYMRGDTVTEADIAPDPLTWDQLREMTGKLCVIDNSTQSHRWLHVCWVYEVTDERVTYVANGGYRFGSRQTIEEDRPDRPETLKTEGKFFALRTNEKEDTAMIVTETRTPPADANLAVTERYQQAYNLNVKIWASIQAVQQNLYDMCTAIKEMRDSKLYKELGYATFETYTEGCLNMTRVQAYNYIRIIERLPEDFVKSTLQIGVEKLRLLTALTDDQRTEITETVDLESTTVRELKAQIAQLTGKNEAMIRESKRDAEEIRQREAQIGDLKNRLQERTERINEMQEQIDELESRPIEVAVPEPSHEVANLMDAMRRMGAEHDAYNAKIQDDHFRHVQSIHKQHREEMQKLREEYEQKMKEKSGTGNADEAVFAVYLDAVRDAVEAAADFAEESENSVDFSAQLCDLLQHLMEDI